MGTHTQREVNSVKRRFREILVPFFVFYLPEHETWHMRLCECACVGVHVCRCLQADREWKPRHMLIRCCDDGRAEGESEREHWREEWGVCVKRNEDLLKDWAGGGKGAVVEEEERGEMRRTEKMTGSGAVIHSICKNHCWESIQSISLTEWTYTPGFRSLSKNDERFL